MAGLPVQIFFASRANARLPLESAPNNGGYGSPMEFRSPHPGFSLLSGSWVVRPAPATRSESECSVVAAVELQHTGCPIQSHSRDVAADQHRAV